MSSLVEALQQTQHLWFMGGTAVPLTPVVAYLASTSVGVGTCCLSCSTALAVDEPRNTDATLSEHACWSNSATPSLMRAQQMPCHSPMSRSGHCSSADRTGLCGHEGTSQPAYQPRLCEVCHAGAECAAVTCAHLLDTRFSSVLAVAGAGVHRLLALWVAAVSWFWQGCLTVVTGWLRCVRSQPSSLGHGRLCMAIHSFLRWRGCDGWPVALGGVRACLS